jgi:hypothetical protein
MLLDKLQIIDILLGVFIDDPSKRALEFGKIGRYRTSDGKLSPLGMAMSPNALYYDVLGNVPRLVLTCKENYPGYMNIKYFPLDLLKPEYRGHCISFWNDLERFHDTNELFTDKGLSELGEVRLYRLKTRWTLVKDPELMA